jgi:protein phosphatase
MRRVLGSGAAAPGEEEATVEIATQPSSPRVPGSWVLRAGVVSTVGNHREHNEDNYYVPGRNSVRHDGPTDVGGSATVSTHDPANVVFIVADGMGGQQAGEEASRMAVEIIPRAIARRLGAEPGDSQPLPEAGGDEAPHARGAEAVQRVIRDAVAEANQEILGSSGAVTEYANMGTTVVLTLFRADTVYVAGIGDSRAYRLRDGRLERLTKDHSLADALGEAGTISPEEVAHHKYKNVLYNYLGSKDARGGPEEIRVLDLREGDRFLLATDGLTGVVGDKELSGTLGAQGDPQRAAQSLVEQALENDSKDNVTALVIHVEREPVAAA